MRVVRPSKLAGTPVKVIREPYSAEQEVHRFASSLGKITRAETSGRMAGVADAPVYSAGRAEERRAYVRVRLTLPLRVLRIAGQRDLIPRSLQTQDVSSSGVYFLSPCRIEPGTPIEMELVVVHRPLGPGSVRMCTEAHVVRAAAAAQPGWYGVAAAFDDIRFFRDEPLPPRFDAG